MSRQPYGNLPTLLQNTRVTKRNWWKIIDPSQCLEKIVYNAICDPIFPYLTEWQHAYIKGRSCVTQLVLTHHHWAKALDDGCQVDVAFLDFSKAFDTVSCLLLRWCESYLTDSFVKLRPLGHLFCFR